MTEEYYITEITVTVASDRKLVDADGHNLSLLEIASEMVYGDLSGRYEFSDERRVSPEEIAAELEEQGSDPEFLLGDDWNAPDTREQDIPSAGARNEWKAEY
jgi:hypothetical protein